MKKLSLLVTLLLITALVSSCVFLPNFGTSSEESTTGIDVSDEISENSAPEISGGTSEQPQENPMASMTAKEIIDYSQEKSEGASSFVQDVEQTYVMDLGNGNVSTQSISYRGKGNALGTDEAMISYSFTADDRTGNFYYKNGKGYSNSNNVRMSFDCTEREFEEYVEIVIFQAYSQDNDELFLNYLYDNCTVTVSDDGIYELAFSGVLPYDMFAEYMGSDGEYIKQDEEITCDYKVLINSDGYCFSEEMSFGFVMETMGQTFKVTIQSVSAVSSINENVSVVILDTGYTYVGDIDVMYAALSHEYVMNQEYYKAEVIRKYKVNGYGFNDEVTNNIEMNYDGIEQNKYAMSHDLIIDGTVYKQRYYFEDGKVYYKIFDSDIESVEYNLLPKLVYDEWVFCDINLSYGKNFGYTDNGDGTATFTYSITDEIATRFADIYVYMLYGEEYFGLFAEADSADIKEAMVTVVIDTETRCFISHSVKIDANFVFEGETVTFKEESIQTFTTEGVVIPDRTSFMGTSDL